MKGKCSYRLKKCRCDFTDNIKIRKCNQSQLIRDEFIIVLTTFLLKSDISTYGNKNSEILHTNLMLINKS